ncbi:zinc finger protein Helios [Eucyclogobius newberryi]|uniref:zinc finger protein Helios n=1 Tax=Eucyclogobius newberryi TaxID=166745 RepID=UPI003B5A6898
METSGYCSSNGQCSPGKENSQMLVEKSNGQTAPRGPKSPCELTIKQEDEAMEDTDSGSPEEELSHTAEEGVPLEGPMSNSPSALRDGLTGPSVPTEAGGRQSNGDRPFQCSQCGVSFTQKGNLLRHIKLHTGEKPFKCPFCSYACRRRDALTGHLRTHAVGKPHKCNYCGRSYKQRTSLEEHKERCHSYMQGIGLDPCANTGPYTGEVPKDSRLMAESQPLASFDRPPVIERLHNSVAKRKSTTPQKFIGENLMRYSFPGMGYDMGLKYDKQAELLHSHMMEPSLSTTLPYMGADSLRPLMHHPGPHVSMVDVVPMVNPLFHRVLGRGERPGNCEPLLLPPPSDFPSQPTTNGPTSLNRLSNPSQGKDSPNISGEETVDSPRSSPQERPGHPTRERPPSGRPQASPALFLAGERGIEVTPRAAGGPGILRMATERPVNQEGIHVFGREGKIRAFQCDHCRVLFLDHVMYTIHMGCHGYRDPLECNICGHRSKDRYEFSSHIVRGEHTFQ